MIARRVKLLGALQVLAVLSIATSCSATRKMVPDAVNLPAPEGADTAWTRIAGYETADGQRHSLEGQVRGFGDSLRFEAVLTSHGTFTRLDRPRPVAFTVQRDSVSYVDVRYFSPVRTLGLMLLGAGIITFGAVVSGMSWY